MTLELETLRCEVEVYDKEKMIEMAKQKSIGKDAEITRLLEELKNITLQVFKNVYL